MLRAGWDASRGKEAGYTMRELLEAGCSLLRGLRRAGFSDTGSAAALRQLGATTAQMRAGGWGLCALRRAGYTGVDLRLTGFSTAGLTRANEKLRRAYGIVPTRGPNGVAAYRSLSFTLRREADEGAADLDALRKEDLLPGWHTARF